MVEWSRSALLLLTGFALLQILIWAFAFSTPLQTTVRGSPAAACAEATFTAADSSARISLYNTAPLLLPSNLQATNDGEEVWRQLSLLRESTRDGWLHLAGDLAHKQCWFDLVSLMQRKGLGVAVTPRDAKKRWGQRHSNAEARVGSTRISFHYRPLIKDLARDWETAVWKPALPPSVIVYSAGVWDVVNKTAEAETHVDVLLANIQAKLAAKLAAGQRVPTVLFLSAPSFTDAADGRTTTAKTRELLDREEELMERLRNGVQTISTALAAQEAQRGSTVDASVARARVVFVDVKSLSMAAHNRLPAFNDGGVHVMLNPPATAASLAAFTSCHLGQPVWALSAFTPGQIALALLWLVLVGLWVAQQARKIPALSRMMRGGKGGHYQRVGVETDEIELGQAGSSPEGASIGHSNGHSNAAGGASAGAPPSSQSQSAVAYSTPSAALAAYFSSPAWSNVLACLVQLGCVLLFMFLADSNHRVTWWLVGDKQYVRDTFLFILLVLGLLAWRSSTTTTDRVESLLNREQTEEWKGVMQLLFVLYHYFAAKEMYNLIRVFIAAYVWMTGYGNFFFFYKTNDYSATRLVKMLFRLNFFVALVCVALNREFMQYYVCALHTFYFLCVYAMMGLAWQWNKNDKLLLVKFIVLFGVLFVLFDVPSLGVFKAIFSPFSLFYWNSSLHEWWFRSSLDHYATALGMLCAWNVKRVEDFLVKIDQSHHSATRKWIVQGGVAAVAVIAGLLWMVYCLWLPKLAYNTQHPYTSIIPIALYILLRNLTPWLRRHVLALFTWFGKITLETYILQFHVWLSDDAATILTYFPNYPLLNWVLSSAIYVALSVLMFQITNILSDALIPRVCSVSELVFKLAVLIGGWYAVHNIVHAAMIAMA